MRGTEGAGSLSRTEQYTIATGGGRVGGGGQERRVGERRRRRRREEERNERETERNRAGEETGEGETSQECVGPSARVSSHPVFGVALYWPRLYVCIICMYVRVCDKSSTIHAQYMHLRVCIYVCVRVRTGWSESNVT